MQKAFLFLPKILKKHSTGQNGWEKVSKHFKSKFMQGGVNVFKIDGSEIHEQNFLYKIWLGILHLPSTAKGTEENNAEFSRSKHTHFAGN